ncbi:transposase [Micrococcus terreus]|uniref:transposase n=1 Tax=Micrococcus terreus TaxID=574650 RepID=UPI0034041C7F
MTAPHILDPAGLLGEALSEASPDMMRHLLQTMINTLLSADADAVIGAEWGKPSSSRTAQRNGYRHRDLDTRVGTLDVAIPKLRSGTYFPDWLLERRKRTESALITVVADCYLAGVSTRRRAPPLHASRSSQRAVPPSWSRPWASTRYRSPRSHGWPPSSTSRSRPSATGRWARPARSRSWPPMR